MKWIPNDDPDYKDTDDARYVKVVAHIRKNDTGEIERVEKYPCPLYAGNDQPSPFYWEEGNAACDCNRDIFFHRARGVELEDEFGDTISNCSEGRYSVNLENPATGDIFYREFESEQSMKEEQEPDNVVKFDEPLTEQEGIPGPKFEFNFSPHPRPSAVQAVLDEFEKAPAEKQREITEVAGEFFACLFYALGGNMDLPEPPPILAELSPNLRGIIQIAITPEFKKFHWEAGWNTLTKEEQEIIAKEIRDKKATQGLYDHLPKDGAKGPDGKFYSNDQLKALVDSGRLPPNPLANVKPRMPNVDMSRAIPTFENAPNGIIKP